MTDAVEVRRSLAHRTGLSLVLWVFGLATTIFLIGTWGRSVSTDRSALEDAFQAVAEADAAAERIEGWIGDALASGAIGEGDAVSAAAAVVGDQEMDAVVEGVVAAVVDAALEVPGSNSQTEVRRALQPLVPLIALQIDPQGGAATEADVAAALDEVAAIVGATETAVSLGTAADATRALTRVATISAVGMLVAGLGAVALAEDRMRMARSLALRLAASGFTFAIVLRLGAWAVDPGGGRAPVAAGGAVLLRSNGGVLVAVGAVALGVVAGLSGVILLRIRRRTASVATG